MDLKTQDLITTQIEKKFIQEMKRYLIENYGLKFPPDKKS